MFLLVVSLFSLTIGVGSEARISLISSRRDDGKTDLQIVMHLVRLLFLAGNGLAGGACIHMLVTYENSIVRTTNGCNVATTSGVADLEKV